MPEPLQLATIDDLAGGHPLLTRDEFEQYRDHLAELRRVRAHDLPLLLRDARGFVANDAAEEIVQILEDQAVVGARIAHLAELLRDARVLDEAGSHAGRVLPGRIVDVRYGSGREASLIVARRPVAGARPVS